MVKSQGMFSTVGAFLTVPSPALGGWGASPGANSSTSARFPGQIGPGTTMSPENVDETGVSPRRRKRPESHREGAPPAEKRRSWLIRSFLG
jgi:hypothetical protein